jgi:hypothetical protein
MPDDGQAALSEFCDPCQSNDFSGFSFLIPTEKADHIVIGRRSMK